MVTGREASLRISLSLAKRHRGSWMPTYSFSMRHNNCPTGLCLCYRFSILYQIDCDVTPPILDISVFVCKVISSSPFENNRLHTHTDVVSSYKLSCFCRIRRYISCAPFALQWLYKVFIAWRCFDPLIPVEKENYINIINKTKHEFCGGLRSKVPNGSVWGKNSSPSSKYLASMVIQNWRSSQLLFYQRVFSSKHWQWINPPFIYDVQIKMIRNTMYPGLNKTIYSSLKILECMSHVIPFQSHVLLMCTRTDHHWYDCWLISCSWIISVH